MLWVDDEKDLCGLAKKIVTSRIESKVTKVLMAQDGVEALELLSKHHVDLIVADVLMPRMDGLELCENIRKKFPILPVILMTAYQDRFDARDCIVKGAVGYFTKPFNVDEIRVLIDRALKGMPVN